jgi:hypothetical protein
MMYPIGESKIIYLYVTSTVSGELLRPPEGKEWLLSWAFVRQFSGAAKKCIWNVYDQYHNTWPVIRTATVNSNDHFYFKGNEDAAIHMTPKFTNLVYPYVEVQGVAGFELAAQVIERPANLELLMREWYADLVRRPLPAGLENLRTVLDSYRSGV